ncbi:MAG: hypothetical protein H6810_10910 [Phycisphaeraceae bacterium]|nr:MAG: hypothetical protein H6810_10910 [Phycisphaeraceae bacterium]
MSRLKLFVLALAASIVSAPAGAEIIPIRQMEIDGQATITASPWDIGHKDALCDGDYDNVYRSANINPAIVTVEFNQPVASGACRGRIFASPCLITLEAADSLADLDSKTGSYTLIFEDLRAENEQVFWIEWNNTPITRRVFRWEVYRLEYDNYVHIRELELQTVEPVEVVVIGGDLVRLNTLEFQPADLDGAVGDSRQVTALGSLSYGPDVYDVSELMTWTSDDPGVATVAPGGLVTFQGPGETIIHATRGVLAGEVPVSSRAPRPVDLDVGFINRQPEYNRFRVAFNGDQTIQPGLENEKKWPDPGEMVTYTANVFNRGDVTATDVPYVWRFDGEIVGGGRIPLMLPNERYTLSYQAPWPADTVQTVDIDPGVQEFAPIQYERAVGDHTIEFQLDPYNKVDEYSELNNSVLDYINALQFHLWIDETTYAEFLKRPNFIETYSPEDWAQLQVEALQRKIWISGGRQRLRMSNLQVVPDGTLDPGGTHEPYGEPTLWADSRWGFDWPVSYLESFIKRTDQALVHELGHQLGFIDIYSYDVAIENMDILHPNTGLPVADTALMPRVSPWNVYYGMERYLYKNGQAIIDWTDRGAMANTGARYFGPGTIAGLNRNLGLRRGFYGDFLLAIPPTVSIRLVNADGSPVPDAVLRVFQRELDATVPNTAKFTGRTDAQGLWTFPDVTRPEWHGGLSVDTPWSWVDSGGTYFRGPDPVGRNAPLVLEFRFRDENNQIVTEYHFLEVDRVNIAFDEGQTDEVTVDIVTHRSRAEGNTLPEIHFSDGSIFTILEGDELRFTVSATDADGDDVSLKATPIANSSFDPQTGEFVFAPDALQVNEHEGSVDYASVVFTASDGKATVAAQVLFEVLDDPSSAVYREVVPEPGGCAGDFAPAYGELDFFDMIGFLREYDAGNAIADTALPAGALNQADVLTVLLAVEAGCD